MSMFLRKKKTNRQVFGFLCDNTLAAHVKMVAGVIKVPIYTLCEHLLQLGLAHISAEMSRDVQNLGTVIGRLRVHLVNEHLLVKELAREEYERDLVARHLDLTPEQEEKVKAVLNLVEKFEDEGIPHGLAIEIIEELVTRLERQRKVQQMERELRRQIDFETLRQVNKRFPRLIPGLLELMAKYTAEDLKRAASPIKQ